MALSEFLAGLRLEVAFRKAVPGDAGTVHDIVSRVGAFKLEAALRDESDWRAILEGSDIGVWLAEVTDRFGRHGASGVVSLGRNGPHLVVDTMALSCRVLGKGVELRVLGMIAEHAVSHGAALVRIEYHRTSKNAPLGEFLAARLSAFRVDDGPAFEVPCEELRRLAHLVGPAPMARTAGVSFSLESFVRQRWLAQDSAGRAETLAGAAGLANAASIDAAVAERASRGQGANTAPYVAPTTALERILTGIWREVLGVPRVGMLDHFFHLGGHSLLVTQMLSRLRDTLQIELGLTDAFQSPTVAELLVVLERVAGPLERLERVAMLVESVLSMSDDDVESVLSSRDEIRAPAASEARPLHGQPLAGTRGARELAYWQKALAEPPLPPALDLPLDRPRRAPRDARGGTLVRDWSSDRARAVVALALQNEATPSTVLLGAFGALLGRLSRTRDLVVGVPVANRADEGLDDVVGFVNTLAIRLDADLGQPARAFLDGVKRRVTEALDHQLVPFERVVEALEVSPDLRHSPVFQVMFVMNAAAPGTFDWLDLTLTVDEVVGGGHRVSWEYREDVFDRGTVERIASAYERLLDAMIDAPGEALGRLPLLDGAERRGLLAGPRFVAIPEARLHDLFEAQVRQRPDATALIAGREHLTYAELEARANRLAAQLLQLGVTIGECVGIALPRGVEVVVAMVAVMKAGAAYVPLDPKYPTARLEAMSSDARLRLVITSSAAEGQIPGSLERVLVDVQAGEIASRSSASPGIATPPDAAAYVLFTSGSTGRPKGVSVPHRGIVNLVHTTAQRWPNGAGARVSAFASVSFDVSVFEIWSALGFGATLLFATEREREDLDEYALWTLDEGVTTCLPPTAALETLLATFRRLGRSPVRQLWAGVEPIPASLLGALGALHPGGVVVNGYGPTEVSVIATFAPVEPGTADSRPAPLGDPADNLSLYVLDEELEPVVANVVGELYLAGIGLAHGYVGAEDRTAERFVPCPFLGPGARMYRTGDLARKRVDGRLEFVGRVDHQVKLRGHRIELGEIEEALESDPAVSRCIAMLRSDTPGEPLLVAYVAVREGSAKPDEAALRERARARLTPQMVPGAYVVLDSFPRTPAGKLDRGALPAPDRGARSETYVAPRDPLEEAVVTIWSEVLGVPQVGVYDDFFEQGGHSLLAARLMARVRDAFRVALPLQSLFEVRTPARLALLVGSLPREVDGSGELVPAAGSSAGAPASHAQERLWFLEQLDPGKSAYNVPILARLEGDLDPDRLRHSIGAVVARHAALRTLLHVRDGDVLPVELLDLPPSFALEHVSGATPEALGRAAERIVAEEVARPFDLVRGPLVRALLVRLAPGDHLFSLCIHHTATDGWSTGLVLRDLSAAYRGALEALPPPRLGYHDFARWQREVLRGPRLAVELAFWLKTLAAPLPPPIELPFDRPRRAPRDVRGNAIFQAWPRDRVAAVGAMARKAQCTPFMVLIGAFAVLLARLSRTREVVIGVPVANRAQRGFDEVVGFFVNTLAVRIAVEPSQPSSAFLEDVKQRVASAIDHQLLPFERIVEKLGLSSDLQHHPVFQVMFAMNTTPTAQLDLPDVRVSALPVHTGAAKFDLTLMVDEQDAGYRVGWEFREDIFDRETIERIASAYEQVVAAMLATPGTTLGLLPLVDECERRALLRARIVDPACAGEALIHEVVAERARETPHAVAIVLGDEALTYEALLVRARCVARALVARGVGPDVIVAVLAERTPELVVGILGVLLAGGAYLPIDPVTPPQRAAFMVQDSGAALLLVDDAPRPPLGIPGIVIDDLVRERGAPQTSRRPLPDQLAYVIYTSGTTGRPKGVMVTHRNVMRLFETLDEKIALRRRDVMSIFHSFAFDVSVFELWGALLHGGSAVIVPRLVSRTPAETLDLLERTGVTVLSQTPTAFSQLLSAGAAGRQLDALRLVIFAGEALQFASLRAWFDAHGDARPQLINMFGITETTVHVTYRRVFAPDARGEAWSGIGDAMDDLELLLLDDAMDTVPVGVVGDVYVAGPGLARGYLGRPDLTASRFRPHPFSRFEGDRIYDAGDLARRRRDGEVLYLGRADHQVQLRGYRIELGEIESVLLGSPLVQQAAVLFRSGDAVGDRIVAYVAGFSGAPRPQVAELRRELGERLPEYMVPSAVVVLDALPLTQNGKVDRRALPAPEIQASGLARPAETATELVLATLWQGVLGLEQVSRDDDFFAVGGHSLLATRLVARIRETLRIEVPLGVVFETRTLERMAAAIDRRASATALGPALLADPGAPPTSSPAQDRLWFLEQLDPGKPTYNVAVTLRLEGELDVDHLRRALGAVVRRHAALRTVVREIDGGFVPEEREDLPPSLEVQQAPGATPEGRAAAADGMLAEEIARPFDLRRGPLLRGRLVCVEPEDHRLSLCVHHIATDGWSMGLVLRDLSAAYRSSREGEDRAQVMPSLRYQDFARWQRQLLAGPRGARELTYWHKTLAEPPLPPALDLPLDRPRRAPRDVSGGTLVRGWSSDRAGAVVALARQEEATPFMVLLGAFGALLGRLSRTRDLVVGVPVANRADEGLDDVVGFFVNTLAIRLDVDLRQPARAFLDGVKRRVTEALDHQLVPFERVVEALGVSPDLRHSPVFQVMFVMNAAAPGTFDFPGVEVTALPLATGTAKFDLTLTVDEVAGGGHRVSWEYREDVFDRGTVERIASAYERLLDAMIGAPGEELGRLALLDEVQRRDLLAEPRRAPIPEARLHDLFEAQVRQRPDATALIAGREHLTYAELEARANRLAAQLLQLGVTIGECVGIALPRGVEVVVAMVAVMKAGAAYVPLDPKYPTARLEAMSGDARLRLVITSSAAEGPIPGSLERVLVDVQAGEIASRSSASPGIETSSDATAYVLFTSGSTGRPKGVSVPHRGVVNLLHTTEAHWPIGAGARASAFASVSFDVSVYEIWSALAFGGTLLLAVESEREDLEKYILWTLDEGIVACFPPAAALEGLLAAVRRNGRSSMRRMWGGVEPIPASLLGAISALCAGGVVLNSYGPTEVSITSTVAPVQPGSQDGGPAPLGEPVDNLSVYVLDEELEPVLPGVVGEIYIAGVGLAHGYVGAEDRTAERFVPCPFLGPGARMYRTGDSARRRGDGRLDFAGRVDHQVKLRGHRIELGEIEEALESDPAVSRCIAMLRSDTRGEPWLVAYVAAREGSAKPDEAALRERARARLTPQMVPGAYVVLDSFPRTAAGKIDRRALPAPVGTPRPDHYAAPRDPVEQVVVDIWSDVLGAEHLGIHDDFFERGGHSLLAARLIARIRQAFGVDLPLRRLFEARTPARIAALIGASAREEGEALPVATGKTSGHAPASYAQERLWFLSRLAPGSSAYNLWEMRHLRGPLDAEALRGALSDLAADHVALRTTIEERGTGVVQVFQSAGAFPLELVDLPAGGGRRLEEAHARADEFAGRPFELAAGPLARALLVRLAPDDHVFCLSFHHAIADGWSMGLLARDLRAAYSARRRGVSRGVRAPAPDYDDFAIWQRAKPGRFDDQLSHWRTTLAGAPPALELPTDRPRPSKSDGRGGIVTAVVEATVAERLRAVARQEGATTFMALLAALDTVLSRWANQEEVVVGTPMANRSLPGTEDIVGLFLESLALRTRVETGQSFRGVLRAVKSTCLEAFAHADVPFDRVVEALAPERNLARHPVFQVFFNMLNVPDAAFDLEEVESEELAVLALEAKFDLTVYAQERRGEVELSCVYATQLFEAARMEELLGQVVRAVDAFGRRPDEPQERVSLRGALPSLPDPSQALETRGAPRLLDVLARHLAERPGARAAEDAVESYSYADLDATMAAIAHQLAGLSIAEGNVVAVFAERSAGLLAAVLGVLRSGAAFTIVDPAHPPERTRRQADLALPRALVIVGNAPPETALQQAGLAELPRLAVRRVVGGTALPALPALPVRRAGTLAYVAFTSGTTGEPKAIAGRLEPIEHFLDWQASTFGLGAEDRGSLLSGLAHDPLLRDLFAPLWSGGCVVAPPFQLAEATARWLRDARITLAHLTPQIGELVVSGTAGELPDLRAVFFGGDALPMALARRLLESAPMARCVSLYGATETPQGMGYHEITRRPDGEGPSTAPLGRGIDGVELLVVAAGERPAAVGEVGEIWIRSRHLARYAIDEEAWQARFTANPFRSDPADGVYRTGDLGRYRADGAVVFAGRRDRQLKIRGFRIEPGEIEATLRREEGVEAVHAGVVEVHGRPTLVAWVVGPRAGETAALRAALERALPAASVPAFLLEVSRIPLGATGKVDHAALPLPAIEPSIEEPRSPSEQTVTSVLGEALGISTLAPTSDFFASGGHSLLVPRIAARLSALFGVEVPLAWFFEAPTARGLATRLDETRSGEPMSPLRPRPAGSATPLSFSQERLWFLHQLDPESSAYNLLTALRIEGTFDVVAWSEALRDVGRRHASLRTRFTEGSEGRLQIVDDEPTWRLEVVDLTDEPGTADQHLADARERLRLAGLAPFDLATGPLVRASVWKVGAESYVALLALHHAIADGWSLGVLLRDLTEAYAARRGGAAPAWYPLPVDYADFSAWQRETLRGARLERQLAYHKSAIQGAPTLLELPTDRPRSPIRRRGARRLAVNVEREVADRVRDLARSAAATPFMVLLAAFGAMLGRASRQKDLVVGSPIAGRTAPETESLVGFFVNTLALRIQLHEEPTFLGLLERVRATCLGAFANQDLPFERLVEELAPERRLDATPIFQVLFLLQSQPRSALTLPGARLELLERQVEAAKFDLVLALHEEGGGYAGRFDYSADLFEASSAESLWRAFHELLAAAVSAPDTPISQLPMVDAETRDRLQLDYNRTALDYPQLAIHEMIEAQTDATPDATALVFEDHAITYLELERRANQLAHRLRVVGVEQGDRVALCVERSLELIIAQLGIMKAGAAYVGLDPNYPAARLALMIETAAASAVVTQASFRSGAAGVGVLEVPRVLVDAEAAELGRQPRSRLGLRVHPDDPAYVLFTSGSTGRPKGVCIHHRGVPSLMKDIHRLAPTGAGDRCSFWTSISFDVSVKEIFSTLFTGGALWIATEELRADPDRFAQWLLDHGIHGAYVAPFGIDAFLRALERAGTTPMKRLFVGVEPIPERTLARIGDLGPDLVVLNSYGPTEATICCTLYVCPSSERGDRPSVIGLPTANTQLYVLDDQLAFTPRGVRGELYIGGIQVGPGYWGSPRETAERFVPDHLGKVAGGRLYRTGDLVRMRGDLAIEFWGRIDNQVKVRGHRIELGEIEAATLACVGVRNAVAVVQGQGEDKRLVVYFVPDPSAPPATSTLRDHLKSRLPEAWMPSRFMAMASLPLTPSGKIDRKALPEVDAEAELHVAPRTPIEELVATAFAELLGKEDVSAEADFFALGGHSLLATRLVSRLRQALRVALPLRAVFESPTVAALAAQIASLGGGGGAAFEADPIERADRGVPIRASFTQERLWMLDRLEPGSPAYQIRSVLCITGPVDEAALRRAFVAIVQRHEALRTCLEERDGVIVQTWINGAAATMGVVDLGSQPESDRVEVATRLAVAEADRAFDLGHDLPIRALLLRLGDELRWLVLTVHHAMSDGWSMSIVRRDLGLAYEGILRGSAPQLPPLPLQFADFAAWQRRKLESDTGRALVASWARRLQEAPPALTLRTDHPRPASWNARGASIDQAIPVELARRIASFCRREAVTPFMVLLAAFATVLGRRAGQDDVVLGSPIAGRTRADVENVVGPFINVLPLRVQLDGAPSFRASCARAREIVLEAHAHQEVPFEHLLEALEVRRDPSRSPVFQAYLNMLNQPSEDLALPGTTSERLFAGTTVARFDLTLYARLDVSGGELGLVYAAALFEETTARSFVEQLLVLLDAGVAAPDTLVTELPLIAGTRRAELRADATAVVVQRAFEAMPREVLETSLDDRFRRIAARHADRTAVVAGDERLTYRELRERSERAAAALGDVRRVALLFDHDASMVTGILAALTAGAAYVPLDATHPAERLEFMLRDSGAEAILTDASRLGLAKGLAGGLPVVDVAGAAAASERVGRASTADDLAYVLYTSGSTGRPKGVMQSHRNVLGHIRAYVNALHLGPEDRLTLFSTYGFDAAVMDLFGALLTGATLLLERLAASTPEQLWRWVRAEQVTVLHATPTAFRHIASAGQTEVASSVRLIVLGGEPVDPADVAICRALFAPGAIFVNGLGPTESTLALQQFIDPWAFDPSDGVPVGFPVDETDVLLLGPDGSPVGDYGIGEICVVSSRVALGYVNQPEATSRVFSPAPGGEPGRRMYRTGDLGRLLPSGAVAHAGRADDQVKIRGHRIELGEVEAVLRGLRGVRKAAAALHEVEGAPRLCAYLVGLPAPLDTVELRRELRHRLPEAMVPADFVALEAIPLTPTGKVDRRALPLPAAQPALVRGRLTAKDEVEARLGQIWSEVLKRPVPFDADFFDLGGNSLVAVRLVAAIERSFEQLLPLRTVFSHPTVEEMAELLR